MHRRTHRLHGYVAALALAATLALGLTPTALGDDWARDRAGISRAIDGLDPAIRTAVVARTSEVPMTPSVVAPTPVLDDGFAWGAAALGLGVGVGGMCVLFGCVTLLGHHGRLRNA